MAQAARRGDPSRRGEPWRRGSTDFEVFSTEKEGPDSACTPATRSANLSWKFIASSTDAKRARAGDGSVAEDERRGNEGEGNVGGEDEGMSGEKASPTGSVVETGDSSDEAPAPQGFSAMTSGRAAPTKPRGVLKKPASSAAHELTCEPDGPDGHSHAEAAPPRGKTSTTSRGRVGFAEPDQGSGTAQADSIGPRERDGTESAGGPSGSETDVQRLRAKRRQERQGSVQFAPVLTRSFSKQGEGSNGESSEGGGGQGVPETGSFMSRSIRDLFAPKDRDKDHGSEGGPTKVAPAPSLASLGKRDTERRSLIRITSSSAADVLLSKSRKDKDKDKDKDPAETFRDFAGKDADVPIVRNARKGGGHDSPTCTSGVWPRKPVLGTLRSFMKRSNSESRQMQNSSPEVEEEMSSDYAAALAVASRKVERELLNAVRPGRKPIPLPASSPASNRNASADTLPPAAAHAVASERVDATPPKGEGEPAPTAAVAVKEEEEVDPHSVEVEELVHLVEVGDRQVDNLLEGFSAILVAEQEEAAKRGELTEPLPPLPLLEEPSLASGVEDPEAQERQSMIVDGMGRRLLQGPMAHPHPRRKHGRSSHVFC